MPDIAALSYNGRVFTFVEWQAKCRELEVHLAAQDIYPDELDWVFQYDEHVLLILWLDAILAEA